METQLNHDIVLDQILFAENMSGQSITQIIAILIGRGTITLTTFKQAVDLLATYDNCLNRLARASPEEIMRVHGIGKPTARNILAAIELSRRRHVYVPHERPRVSTSSEAYEILRPVLCDLAHEEFWLLLMDRGLRVLERVRLSIGGLHGTVADPKCIFKMAIDKRASCMIVAHNHPSGQLRPSEEDIRLTRKLVEGGRMLDIIVQDHVILTDTGYYSFGDSGQMC